ncbi:hypothetical protein Tco_0096017, partial [Tanacetum coccineum]
REGYGIFGLGKLFRISDSGMGVVLGKIVRTLFMSKLLIVGANLGIKSKLFRISDSGMGVVLGKIVGTLGSRIEMGITRGEGLVGIEGPSLKTHSKNLALDYEALEKVGFEILDFENSEHD